MNSFTCSILYINRREICENDPGKFEMCDYGLRFSQFVKMTCVRDKDNVKQVNSFVYESILSSSRPLMHRRVGTSPRIVPKLGTILTTVPLTCLDLQMTPNPPFARSTSPSRNFRRQ